MDSALGRRWDIAAAAGVVAVLLTVPGVQAQLPCQYEVTVIRPESPCPIFGFPPTFGLGLNEQGHVVGYHWQCGDGWGDHEAFAWMPETGMVDLPRPPGFTEAQASDIDGNQIVGGLRMNNVYHAALWQDGQVIELGTMPGGNFSEARAISGGRIVGKWGNSAIGPIHGFIWQDSVMTDLGPDLGTPSSRANDICGTTGKVVGWMGSGYMQDGQAYIWDDGLVTALGPIPDGFFSSATSINSQSEVVGWGLVEAKGFPVGQTRGFLWRGGKMIDIPPLPGHARSGANDISDASIVIGTSWDPGSSGFILQNGMMTDLNDLISPDLDIHITSVSEVNSSGQIAATAATPVGAAAVLLTPIKTPIGDLDGDGTVGILDLLILLASWGPCPDPPDACPADLDIDGAVGILDLLALLANWGPCR